MKKKYRVSKLDKEDGNCLGLTLSNFTFKLGCQLRESCYSVIFTKKS